MIQSNFELFRGVILGILLLIAYGIYCILRQIVLSVIVILVIIIGIPILIVSVCYVAIGSFIELFY